jgi:hypothetical protein
MTAAHQPDAAPAAASSPKAAPDRPDTDPYGAEDQFIGSLMWLTADQIRPLLDLVPATAIWNPQARWGYELIRRVVESGHQPTPVAVLTAGRRHAAANALHSTAPPNSGQHKRLALYLFDAYAQAVAPQAAITSYTQELLDEAYRRAFAGCGARMQQLADSRAERADLATQFRLIGDELADLCRRADAAATPDRHRP